MQQAVAQRQQSSRPSLSTIAQRKSPVWYFATWSSKLWRIYRVRRLIGPSYNRFDEPWRGRSRSARAHRAHAARMGRAPRLAYVLDLPEVTDGVHIPLRRRGSRNRAATQIAVDKGAFLAGEKIALRVLLQPRMPASNAASRSLSRRVIRGPLASALPVPTKGARVQSNVPQLSRVFLCQFDAVP